MFRDGEAGGRHNPEFTMLEWYRVGWDHQRLIDETAELIDAALALVGVARRCGALTLARPVPRAPRHRSVHRERRRSCARPRRRAHRPAGLTRDDWLDLLLTHRLQPGFADDELLAVYDYPASQAALARIRDGDPPVAERFEMYLGPLELANGYHELTDAAEQRARFERDIAVRAERGAPTTADRRAPAGGPRHGLPACAGVALGVDRLLMAMLGTQRIADVLAFPFDRA